MELIIVEGTDEEATVLLIDGIGGDFMEKSFIIGITKNAAVLNLKDNFPSMNDVGVKLEIFTGMKRYDGGLVRL